MAVVSKLGLVTSPKRSQARSTVPKPGFSTRSHYLKPSSVLRRGFAGCDSGSSAGRVLSSINRNARPGSCGLCQAVNPPGKAPVRSIAVLVVVAAGLLSLTLMLRRPAPGQFVAFQLAHSLPVHVQPDLHARAGPRDRLLAARRAGLVAGQRRCVAARPADSGRGGIRAPGAAAATIGRVVLRSAHGAGRSPFSRWRDGSTNRAITASRTVFR